MQGGGIINKTIFLRRTAMRKFSFGFILLCCVSLFCLSCSDDYEPVDEEGKSFMTLTINLADEIAVPSGSVSVKYGASRNGTAEVSASLSSDGKTASAKLDEYYASSSGKFTTLKITVKKSGSDSALSVSQDKTSLKFDKAGASVNLTAKASSTKTDSEKSSETKSDTENSDETKSADGKSEEPKSSEENEPSSEEPIPEKMELMLKFYDEDEGDWKFEKGSKIIVRYGYSSKSKYQEVEAEFDANDRSVATVELDSSFAENGYFLNTAIFVLDDGICYGLGTFALDDRNNIETYELLYDPNIAFNKDGDVLVVTFPNTVFTKIDEIPISNSENTFTKITDGSTYTHIMTIGSTQKRQKEMKSLSDAGCAFDLFVLTGENLGLSDWVALSLSDSNSDGTYFEMTRRVSRDGEVYFVFGTQDEAVMNAFAENSIYIHSSAITDANLLISGSLITDAIAEY